MTRIPTRTAHEAMQETLSNNYSKLVDAQRKISTGKRITKVSDAPTDAISAMRMRNEEKVTDAYRVAAEDGLSMLATQDSALQDVSTILGRLRELMVSGASEIESDNGRQALATEMKGLREQLVALANATHDGRAVFGGYASAAVSMTGGVVTFVGDGSAIDRRVAGEFSVTINSSGADIFGFSSGDSLFAMMGRAITNIESGNGAAVRADLDVLAMRHADVTNALGSIGGRVNQIEVALSQADSTSFNLRSSRSQLEDVDIAAAAVDLKDAEAAYHATLAVVARMQNVTLLDFLR